MKSLRILYCTAFLFALAVVPLKSKAQISLDSYFNVDWQLNIPLGNKFAKDVSGWGMNFEGGYYVTTNIAVGGFVSFHTNNEYFSRRTINLSPTLSMNSDQIRCLLCHLEHLCVTVLLRPIFSLMQP